ncbi:MAG: hypothetical protein LV468_01000 [Candidatus Nitrosotenuis sp.]|uniref:hypothetical protein n=1 Tax=Candidatus Nitrosotenuis cloacae TaxID=1603555 RepID=UPI00227EB4EF|nr:hypothetical protein [Candidatus Nitrosotenuis cloacae]MDC8437562.1 hypothetical protein [Candidatus Nitrosotenuis sp.]
MYPVSSDEGGIKIKPEYMEQEKMYYCIHNDKVLLVFKDDQEFLNCYEVEDAEIVQSVKKCNGVDEIEKVIEEYLAKQDIKH